MTEPPGESIPTPPRSRRLYVYWGVALTLLIVTALFCWFAAAPYLRTRAKVEELAAELDTGEYARRHEALTSLEEMLQARAGRNMRVFSPAVGPLLSMVGWGGIARRHAGRAKRLLVQIGEPAVPRLLEALKSDEARLRRSSIRILTEMGPQKAPVVAAITPLLFDEDEGVRWVCITCLGRLGPVAQKAVLGLQASLARDTAQNAVACHLALVKITGKAQPHVGPLAGYLKHQDADVRGLAADALGEVGPKAQSAAGQLIRSLSDKDVGVRVRAAAALGDVRAKSPEVVAALIKLLGDDRIRQVAAGALGELGQSASSAVPSLARMLDEARDGERLWRGAEALGKIGGADAEAALRRALDSGDSSVRHAAAKALGDMKPAAVKAVPELKALANDQYGYIREAAAAALKKIRAASAPKKN